MREAASYTLCTSNKNWRSFFWRARYSSTLYVLMRFIVIFASDEIVWFELILYNTTSTETIFCYVWMLWYSINKVTDRWTFRSILAYRGNKFNLIMSCRTGRETGWLTDRQMYANYLYCGGLSSPTSPLWSRTPPFWSVYFNRILQSHVVMPSVVSNPLFFVLFCSVDLPLLILRWSGVVRSSRERGMTTCDWSMRSKYTDQKGGVWVHKGLVGLDSPPQCK